MKIVKANNNSPVRLREQPNGKIIASISQGTAAEVLKTYGDWSEVIINGQTGWMMSKFLVNESPTKISDLKNELNKVLQLLTELEEQL